jgi:hypothetical protein
VRPLPNPHRITSFAGTKKLICFVLELVQGDLPTRVRLQVRIEAVVALHAALASRICPDPGAEFLKVHTYPIETDAASAVWTFDFR